MLQVQTEKVIARSAHDVFNAIKEGRLFMNCGGQSEGMQIDFRVGGKYHFALKNYNVTNFGEFLEIIPDKKVVFNWCQTFGPEQKPDSTVTIELFAENGKTRLNLLHTGFKTQKDADNHKGGWEGVLNDTIDEIQNGSIRMVRTFTKPVEKIYEAIKGELGGDVVESVANQKIVVSLAPAGSRLSLGFKAKDDGGTRLELVHAGLSYQEQKAQRTKWETLTEKLKN